MPPRTLASLAHALGAASDLDAAFVALGEALAEIDRSTHLVLLSFDMRRQLFTEKRTPENGRVLRARVDTTFDHLPARLRATINAGGQFADAGDESDEFARFFGLEHALNEEGLLALRGILVDGHLNTIVVLYEPRRFFGTRVVERFAPYVALFELAFARFSEHEARNEAVRTLARMRAAPRDAPRPWKGRWPPPLGSSSRRTSSCTAAARPCVRKRARSISSIACCPSMHRPPIRASSPTDSWRSWAMTCRPNAARSCCACPMRRSCTSRRPRGSRRT